MMKTRRAPILVFMVVIVIVGIVSVVLVQTRSNARSPARGRHPDSTPAGVVNLPITPTTSSTNAADNYREAAKLMEKLLESPEESAQLGLYEDGALDDKAGDFFKRHAQIVAWVRAGAAAPVCDWGGPATEARIPSLNGVRSIAGFTFLHADYSGQQKDFTTALDDLFAAMVAGRHVGAEPVLVTKLVEFGIEAEAIKRLCLILPDLSREQLAGLSRRLDALPGSANGRQLMQGEFDFVLDQWKAVMSPAAVDSLELFHQAAADAWDKPQPEFAKLVKDRLAAMKTDMLVQQVGSTYLLIREGIAVVETRRAMLRTAIEVLIEGESAVARSRDPHGNGPFGYSKTAGGFELTSQLQRSGLPVKLTVGR